MRAAVLRGDETISVRFFDGDVDTAFVLGVQSNLNHGLPLTSADREAAVCRILRTHPNWSNRAIAAVTGISAKTVGVIRTCATGDEQQLHTRLGLDGKSRPVDAAAGRRRAGELIAENPTASLRQIARAAGVSPGTVRNVRERLRSGQDPVPVRASGYRKRQPEHTTVVRRADIDSSTLARLRQDPALRLSERGRALLQLLDAHTRNVPEWAGLADAVPAHCLDAVAALARELVAMWQEFSERVESRAHDLGVVLVAR